MQLHGNRNKWRDFRVGAAHYFTCNCFVCVSFHSWANFYSSIGLWLVLFLYVHEFHLNQDHMQCYYIVRDGSEGKLHIRLVQTSMKRALPWFIPYSPFSCLISVISPAVVEMWPCVWSQGQTTLSNLFDKSCLSPMCANLLVFCLPGKLQCSLCKAQ